MPDRISIDIEGMRDAIQTLADAEERKITQMIRVLVKEALEARNPPKSQASEFLLQLARMNCPSDGSIAKAARELAISEESLIAIRDRLFPKTS